jgi:hypothetical protein
MKEKEMEFPNLFSGIKINSMELKNRIVMTAMHLGYAPEGFVTDRLLDFYSLRARGGVGLRRLADEIRALGKDIYIIGDANGPKKAMDAIREGYMAGLRI